MTLHLVALPHTRVSADFNGCAYTAKALKFCRMMDTPDGADVILYAPEGSTRAAAETVECLSDAERQLTFGPDDPHRLPAWPTPEQSAPFNLRAAAAIAERYAPGDLILLTAGWTHEPVRRIVEVSHPGALFCEPGVGYEGILTDLCAFESTAWRHYVYGKQGITDGRWFDAVIPNYFDPDEFQAPLEVGGYLVFLGRLIPRKGPTVALEIAERVGLPLIVAGAGGHTEGRGRVTAGAGTPDRVVLEGDVTYVGPVTVGQRAELLAGALALVAPTSYIEPFGGVAVEAMLAGTPAITSDWGAFTETVTEGVTGFRFRTLQEGVRAVERSYDLRPQDVRQRAIERYSLDAVRPQFTRWFDRLRTLHGEGWYEMAARAGTIAV